MPAPTINHRKVSALADDPTADMSSGEWNDSLVIRGDGTTGQVLQRDTSAPDGWSLTSTITQSSGVFSTSIAVGAAPATVGAVRLSANTAIYERNAANTGDVPLIGMNTSDQIVVGWRGGAANPTDAGFLLGPSFNGLGVSGSTAPNWTWTVINTGHFIPQNTNTFDLGDATHTVRAGYFGTSVSIGTTPATTGAIRLATGTSIKWRDGTNSFDFGMSYNASNQFVMEGDLIPSSDDAKVIGSASTRWAWLYLSRYLAIGSLPATTGGIRFGVGQDIQFRNAANTANISGLLVYSDNRVYIGDGLNDAGLVLRTGTNIVAFLGTTNLFPALRRSGTELQAILADGSDYATVRAKTFLSTSSFQTTTAGSYIAIGTPSASAGAIRLENTGYIYARNGANTGDVLVLGVDSSNRTFITSSAGGELYPGSGDNSANLGAPTRRWGHGYFAGTVSVALLAFPSAGASGVAPYSTTGVAIKSADGGQYFYVVNGQVYVNSASLLFAYGGSPKGLIDFTSVDGQMFVGAHLYLGRLGGGGGITVTPLNDNDSDLGQFDRRWRSAYFSTAVAIGANPSSSGIIRLPNGQSINARNAANTGDIGLLRTNTSDHVFIGTTTNWTAIRTLLSATPVAASGFWWMEETGSSPNRQLRLGVVGSDGVTYYQNIGVPH